VWLVVAVVVVAVVPSPKVQLYEAYGGDPPVALAVKVVLTASSVGFALMTRITARADPTLKVTVVVALTVRMSVAVTVAVNVPLVV